MTRRRTTGSHTKGERNGNAKLTEAKVRWICEITAYVPGVGFVPGSIERAADETGLSRAAVRMIGHGERWAHVE